MGTLCCIGLGGGYQFLFVVGYVRCWVLSVSGGLQRWRCGVFSVGVADVAVAEQVGDRYVEVVSEVPQGVYFWHTFIILNHRRTVSSLMLQGLSEPC